MSRLPNPLAWMTLYCDSISVALGTTVTCEVRQQTNPLIFKATFQFGDNLTGKESMLVWNLFQKFAHANESLPQGRVEREGQVLTVQVGIKRLMGPPREKHPAG